MRAGAIAMLSLVAAAGAPTPATAHGRSMSYSTWTLDASGAEVELRVKELELTREPPGHPWTTRLPNELTLSSDGRPCEAGEANRVRPAPQGWAVFRWRVRCETNGPRAIRSELFAGTVADHTHFLRAQGAADPPSATPHEHVLVTGRDAVFALAGSSPGAGEAPGEEAPSSFVRFVALGAEHIASGWDHLAFVVALLLLAGTLSEVAVLVTSFTAAHSLTLGLAVLGVVRPEATAVEVLIAFSIALVAAENTWLLAGRDRIVPAGCVAALVAAATAAGLGVGALGATLWLGLALFSGCHFGLLARSPQPARLRAALAFGFGLVHGFGFAGVLMELDLPAPTLVRALVGFNVGVELGQLAIVAVAWPLFAVLSRRSAASARVVAEVASAAIFALGLFWIAQRAF